MSIKDVVAQLDAVLDTIDAARASLHSAADLIDEATTVFGAAVSGSDAPDAREVLAWFGQAQQGVRSRVGLLSAASDMIRTYRTRLVGVPIAGTPAAGGTAGRIEELRRELPPSVVPGAGQKTHGRWIDMDGTVHAEVSGKDEKSVVALRFFEDEMKARRVPVTIVDVEIKLAVHMRKNGIRSAVLVLNNQPCRGPMGCNALIPVVLPTGYTMIVYGPDGFRQVYQGGGTSKWVP